MRRRGESAERLAESWLQAQGLVPTARNLHLAGAELDLVMQDGETVVFIEVKHRSRNDFGDGAESVSPEKRRHLSRAAQTYMANKAPNQDGRFDVISIRGQLGMGDFDWIQDAFDLDDA